jgi:glycosyltransferase involved in cell wall biosynthesis
MALKVVHITANETGGAGIACRRLHDALLGAGVDSHILFFTCKPKSLTDRVHSVFDYYQKRSLGWYFKVLYRLNLLYNRIGIGVDKSIFINGPRSLFRIEQMSLLQQADIIHLHWVPKMIHFPTFFAQKSRNYIWTMHDMQPFTGGYHYLTGHDEARFGTKMISNEALKKKSLRGTQLHVISPSSWLAELARKSAVFSDFEVSVVPNTVPIDVFMCMPRDIARAQLGITDDPSKKYLLFVAENISDERKGFGLLTEAIAQLPDLQGIALLVLGNAEHLVPLPVEVHKLGYISDAAQLNLAYNAADLFVIPSLEDNLPNTIVESLACGTPVIGYAIGGIPDLVITGLTGQLVHLVNDDLATQIQYALSHPPSRQVCRDFIVKKASPATVAGQMLSRYQT